jgi:simple sugar transport system ATP-binding protein
MKVIKNRVTSFSQFERSLGEETSSEATRYVRLKDISKIFPGGVIANQGISCEAKSGEIHAILGENGAGKTTLMRVLAGYYKPDGGSIEIDGQKVEFRNPKDARLAGIGMVYQHFSLIPALTVAENLALGSLKAPLLVKPRRWRDYLIESASRLQIDIRPDEYVSQLSTGERQRVEIFRLVLEGARILILDEPTSILAPQEAERLFEHLRRFAQTGHIIFLVTHKIAHVKAITDQVTILRAGRVVATKKTAELSAQELASLMVGRDFYSSLPRSPVKNRFGNEPILDVRDLTVKPMSCPYGLSNLSFELREGEILGVAGISGNGQDELVAALTGTTGYSGAVHRGGDDNERLRKKNFGYIPADRLGVGVAPSLSLRDNLALREYGEPPLSVGPFLKSSEIEAFARQKISDFDIRPNNPGMKISLLSGGNIQKAILARELARRPDLLIAVNPTAGLDIGTVEFVHRRIAKYAEEGAGILIISEDLDELIYLCDRSLVLFAGRLMGIVDTPAEDRSGIGLLMSGVVPTKQRLQAG